MNLDTAIAARDLEDCLKNFPEITARLRNGEMIGRASHGFYRELRDHHDAYTTLIKMMGQTLLYHASGFYHILEEDNDNFSDRSKSAAVVAFCIVEQLGNKGSDPSQIIDKATVLNQDFIDSVLKDQVKNLRQLNLHHLADFQKAINTLNRLGFISVSEDTFNEGIVLLHPFHFYLDACRKATEQVKDIDQDLLQNQDVQP